MKLSGDLEPKAVAAIRNAVLRHKVVFFRDQQHPDEANRQAFGRLLGPIGTHPAAPALTADWTSTAPVAVPTHGTRT